LTPHPAGGWNLFITVATALDASTPLSNVYLATPCPNDIAGFPCDEELQRLRRS
jgi:peptide/nickel transport system substrate-binding protein